MKAHLYELHSLLHTYSKYNHSIAFHSSVNAFKVTLKLWHLYQKYGVFPHTLNQLL